jgi:hypothetical protein
LNITIKCDCGNELKDFTGVINWKYGTDDKFDIVSNIDHGIFIICAVCGKRVLLAE